MFKIWINVSYDKQQTPIYKEAKSDKVISYDKLKELKQSGYMVIYQYEVGI